MALPDDITTIILTGTYLDMEGNERSGTVTFTPSTPVLVDSGSDTILGGLAVTAALTEGAFSVVLPCTSGLVPSGWLWQVTENVSGAATRSYAIALPSTLGSTVDISTLTPVGYVPTLTPGAMPAPAGTALAGQVPVATSSGDGSVWTTLTAGSVDADANGAAAAALETAEVYAAAQASAAEAASLSLASGGTVAGPVAFTGEVTGQAPVNPSDLVTKAYADGLSTGLSPRTAVQESTTGPLPSNTYSNGSSGVGATLTATANGALVADTISVSVDDRVLVIYEATAANNGIYSVTATGSPSAPWVLTRVTDMDTGSQFPAAYVFVEQGASPPAGNKATGWVIASAGPFTVGTTAVNWTQFSSLPSPVPVSNGGTGQGSRQLAINALAGAVTDGQFLRGSGSNVVMEAIQVTDVPVLNQSTTGTAANLSGTPALPNGTTAVTQGSGDNSTKLATTAYVATAVAAGGGGGGGGGMPAPSGTAAAGQVPVATGTGNASAWGTPSPASGTGRTATVVVAASNATSKSKAAADYVCTGYDGSGSTDSATIQSAIRALNGAGGGRLILTEGSYWRTQPVYIDGPGGGQAACEIIVEGQGDATQFKLASGGGGTAHIVIGSLGAYDGITYTGGDTAPTVGPQEIILRDFLIQDYAGEGEAVAGSTSGILCRGSVVHIENVNTKVVALDAIRHEGFKVIGTTGAGTAGTLGAAVTTTPAWGTTETWDVSMTSPPGTPFTCIVTPSGGGDYDAEIVNVTSRSGTSWTVQRGWMQTPAKAHASGASIAVLTYTTQYNNITRDCFLYSPLRSGLFSQQGLDDSEYFGCIINGGSSKTVFYTEYGIWAGGSNVRYIACHPYYCTTYGFYGNPQTNGDPSHIIIAGEYETNGLAGICWQQAQYSTITGGTALFANATYDILLADVNNFRIADVRISSGTYRNIMLNSTGDGCTQGSIHDNVMSGGNTGYMIEVNGAGPSTNAEISIHDNVFAASGSTYATALHLSNVGGVKVHHNVFEEGIAESGTSDFNVITGNTMADPVQLIAVSGAHTRAYDNSGVADYQYASSNTTAKSDQLYQLSGGSNTVALSPPGSGAGATALVSTGVTLPASSLSLTSGGAWPASGYALIPVSGGGYTVVPYTSISGNTLNGCSGGSGTTASGNAYICPDASMKFRVVATNTANACTIPCPPGMTINGSSSALTLTAGHVYTAVLSVTPGGANWLIY